VIQHAAVKRGERIWYGTSHSVLMKQAILDSGPDNGDLHKGYLTDKGEFLSRKMAFVHAVDSGQIQSTGDIHLRVLHDFELWP